MDISRIDLNLLVVFAAIGRTQSVTQAARELGLSQPAVSAALARLRLLVGDPLFVRGRRGMQPTLRAQQMRAPVEAALEMLRASLHRRTDFDPAGTDHVFTLLMSDLGEMFYLPRLMDHVRRTAPGVGFSVLQLSQGRYVEALESGAADLAIGHLAELKDTYHYRRLFSESFVCLVRDGHPQIGSTLTWQDYARAGHVVRAARRHSDDLIARVLAAKGVHRKVALTVPHFHAIPDIVAGTDLIATIPVHLAQAAVEARRIRVLPPPFDVPSIEIGIHWHPRSHSDPANRWLRGVMIDLFCDRRRRQSAAVAGRRAAAPV